MAGAYIIAAKMELQELYSRKAYNIKAVMDGGAETPSLLPFHPILPVAGEPVIIDTDPGVDDALALVLASAAGMRLEGVTIVHGNGSDIKQVKKGGTAQLRASVWRAHLSRQCQKYRRLTNRACRAGLLCCHGVLRRAHVAVRVRCAAGNQRQHLPATCRCEPKHGGVPGRWQAHS